MIKLYLHSWGEESTAAGYTKPGWYFWDEAQIYCYGPFKSKEDAKNAKKNYCITLNMKPKQEYYQLQYCNTKDNNLQWRAVHSVHQLYPTNKKKSIAHCRRLRKHFMVSNGMLYRVVALKETYIF